MVQVNKQGIQETAASIKYRVENIRLEINMLNNILDLISSSWEGTDATSYINTMKTNLVPQLEELAEILESYYTYLEKVPDAYELLDEIYSNKF